jgi:hypothetical protein
MLPHMVDLLWKIKWEMDVCVQKNNIYFTYLGLLHIEVYILAFVSRDFF